MGAMKILFLHPNFPAQFKHLAEHFAEGKHEVKFLCETHYGRRIKGVKILVAKSSGTAEKLDGSKKSENARNLQRAAIYRECFIELKDKQNWSPDLIISHCGWGCGIHAKEIWTNAQLISYMEWWFSPASELTEVLRENKNLRYSPNTIKSLWKRNTTASAEICNSTRIIAPTLWQKEQLPEKLKTWCEVIYDGIDLNRFTRNDNLFSKKPLITYGTRGMEPMRCFPEFIKSLPILLSKWPQLHIEIAGEDEVCYGGRRPKSGSWAIWAKIYLQKHNVGDRVHWVGRLDFLTYISWLQSSWCHVYLTQPYVLSWSFLEAACCGTPLVFNRTGCISEFLEIDEDIGLIKDLLPESIETQISKVLRNPGRWEKAAKFSQGIRDKVDLNESMKRWDELADLEVHTIV